MVKAGCSDHGGTLDGILTADIGEVRSFPECGVQICRDIKAVSFTQRYESLLSAVAAAFRSGFVLHILTHFT